jgi:hypothetical protein
MTQFASIYAPLAAVYNTAGKPASVTNSGAILITLGMTEAQKLAAIASWTVDTGTPQKALLQPTQIINAIVPADYAALTALPLQQLTGLLLGSVVDASVGTLVRIGVQTIFAGKTTTLQQLGALVAPFDNGTIPWWQSVGLFQMPNHYDLIAAGIVTGVPTWSYAPSKKRVDDPALPANPNNPAAQSPNLNIILNVVYSPLDASGSPRTDGTPTVTESMRALDLSDATVMQTAIRRIVNVLLPRDAAFAALTSA